MCQQVHALVRHRLSNLPGLLRHFRQLVAPLHQYPYFSIHSHSNPRLSLLSLHAALLLSQMLHPRRSLLIRVRAGARPRCSSQTLHQ